MSRDRLPQPTERLVHRLQRVAKFLDAQTGAEPDMAARANTCWQSAGRLEELETKYFELLYAVGNKFAGEDRHATALRYIRNAEQSSNAIAKAEGRSA